MLLTGIFSPMVPTIGKIRRESSNDRNFFVREFAAQERAA
jgi:hypothetical protein